MKVAIAQICSGPDPWASLFLIASLIDQAAREDCALVCFPENAFYRGPRASRPKDILLSLENGYVRGQSEFSRELAEIFENSKIAVSLGSVLEDSGDSNRPFNSHWFFRPSFGIESYKKIHLFTFLAKDTAYDEAKNIRAGEETVVVPIGEFRAGLSICYDLRFPELYRTLSVEKKANLLLAPAAFTRETGQAHWHTLLRARAIENLSYVVASAQWGEHLNDEQKSLSCFGHSLAYDPWGELLAEAPERGDHLLMVDLSVEEVARRRQQLPVFDSVAKAPFFSCQP